MEIDGKLKVRTAGRLAVTAIRIVGHLILRPVDLRPQHISPPGTPDSPGGITLDSSLSHSGQVKQLAEDYSIPIGQAQLLLPGNP